MSRNRIRIHNRPEDCAHFTSLRRAARFVRTGLAFINGSDELEFFESSADFLGRLEVAKFDRAIAERGKSIFYWNGERRDRAAMCKPGEARS
jgi:hypothetical protein